MDSLFEKHIIPAVSMALEKRGLLHKESVILAGISGGVDSMALLHSLARLRDRYKFNLHILHVEHGLRGKESRGDAAFVQEVCERYKIPCHIYAVDCKKAMQRHGGGLEENARRLRYASFEEAILAYNGEALLLAHHRDDQIETVLLHLMRGAGAGGLGGMPEERLLAGIPLLRPFLGIRRNLLVEAMEEEKYAWREDATNNAPVSLRNRIRNELLPSMESLCQGAGESIARSAEILSLEEDYWRAETDRILNTVLTCWKGMAFVERTPLMKLPKALQQRVLRAFYAGATVCLQIHKPSDMTALTAEKTKEMVACLMGSESKVINLPLGLRTERTDQRLYIYSQETLQPKLDAPTPSIPGETPFDEFLLTAELATSNGFAAESRRSETVDLSAFEGRKLTLRYRSPGDRITPLGMRGSKTLKEYFIDRKIDRPLRDFIPLLTYENEVLWVCGVGISDHIAVKDENSSVIRLTLAGKMPWLNE